MTDSPHQQNPERPQRTIPSRAPRPELNGRRVASRIMLVLFGFLVTFPIVIVGVMPTERQKWQVAAAREAYINGDLDEAIDILDELIAADPENSLNYRLTRAQFFLEKGDAEGAIVASEALIEEFPDGLQTVNRESDIGPAFAHFELLGRAYQLAGNYGQAVEQWELIRDQTSEFDSPNLVNDLAYARALAKEELFDSFSAMHEILKDEFRPSQAYFQVAYMHLLFLECDARFVLWKKGEREHLVSEALIAFERSIAARELQIHELYESTRPFEDNLVLQVGLIEDDDRSSDDRSSDDTLESESDSQEDDGEDIDKELGELRRELATVIAFRAELFELVGDDANAKADRATVNDLGFSSEFLSKQRLDVGQWMDDLSRLAAWIDTRGFLLHQSGQHRPAEKELTHAIRLMEGFISGQRFFLCQRAMQSPEIRDQLKHVQDLEQGLAVLVYHRMLANEAMGNQVEVAEDEERIRSLGEEPGDHLF